MIRFSLLLYNWMVKIIPTEVMLWKTFFMKNPCRVIFQVFKAKSIDTKVDDYATALEVWEVDNSKIITWVNNSVTHSIDAQLEKYDTAKEVWDHLSRLYPQSNFAKQYQDEIDIHALKKNYMSIQDFYSIMITLWDQLALTEPEELSAFALYITS